MPIFYSRKRIGVLKLGNDACLSMRLYETFYEVQLM